MPSCFLKASLCPSKYPAKLCCSIGLRRHVDYFFKYLRLTLNFIKKDVSIKDNLKAVKDCTTLTAINWRDIRSNYFGQHLLFICRKVFVISVTNKTELIKPHQNIGAVYNKYMHCTVFSKPVCLDK